MTYRVRNIGIAVALAVLAAMMISYYVTNYKRHVQHGASDVTVLVATKDIPARHVRAPRWPSSTCSARSA